MSKVRPPLTNARVSQAAGAPANCEFSGYALDGHSVAPVVKSSVRRRVAIVCVVVFLGAFPISAQKRTGPLGVVSTADGRVIAGASVTVTCGSRVTKAITDSSGTFMFDLADSTRCDVTVVTPWFDTFVQTILVSARPNDPVRVVAPRRGSVLPSTTESRLPLSIWEPATEPNSSPTSVLRLDDRWITRGNFVSDLAGC